MLALEGSHNPLGDMPTALGKTTLHSRDANTHFSLIDVSHFTASGTLFGCDLESQNSEEEIWKDVVG